MKAQVMLRSLGVLVLAYTAQPALADTYTQASFSGGVFGGGANVVAPLTGIVSPGAQLAGSFVYDNDLIPGGGTGIVNVNTASFPAIANIPTSSLFSFSLGSQVLTAANLSSGSTLQIQYKNGAFRGFAGQFDFLYQASTYQLDFQGTLFTVRQLVNGVPDFGTNYVNGYLNTSLTNRVSFTPPTTGGAVPEPASWAMMVAGFGLIGGAMRTRKRVLSFA